MLLKANSIRNPLLLRSGREGDGEGEGVYIARRFNRGAWENVRTYRRDAKEIKVRRKWERAKKCDSDSERERDRERIRPTGMELEEGGKEPEG